MNKILNPLLGAVLLLLVGCASFSNLGSLNAATVGSQTTILVQGAEIALQNDPTFLIEFRNGCLSAGNLLVEFSTGSIVISTSALQTLVYNSLISSGISVANATNVSKIVVAEYTLIAAQYGFTGVVTVPQTVNVKTINPFLASIGNALLGA